MTLYRGIGTTDTTGAVGATQSEEVQTATASQTVFTLTTMTFQPGEGNLVIYVNGVRQETSAYTEGVDGVTVTFSEGLEVGDSVAFVSGEILGSMTGSSATNIAYNPLGGSSTTVANKLGEFVSVKDFGADPTGLIDSTAAIQDALNTFNDTQIDGGKLYFPSGHYIVTTALTVSSNLWIQGEGEKTFIDATGLGTGNLFEAYSTANLDDLRISDMRMRGTGVDNDTDTSQGVAIKIDNTGLAERCKFQNLRIERFKVGIKISQTGTAESPEIVNCWFDEISRSPVLIERAKGAVVTGNTVDCDRTGIGDEVSTQVGLWLNGSGTAATMNRNCVVSDNIILKGTTLESIIVRGFHNTVSNNTVEAGTVGILFEPLQTATLESDSQLYCVVDGNSVSGASEYGIALRHDPANADDISVARCIVSNNNVYDCNKGIEIGQTGTTLTAYPAGNVVADNGIYDSTGAALVLNETYDTTVSGNLIVGAGAAGILMQAVCKRTNIAGGLINATGGTSDGISIGGGAVDTHITGVTFSNCTRYGVRPTSGDRLYVTACHFVDDRGGSATMQQAVATGVSFGDAFIWSNTEYGMTSSAAFGSNHVDPLPIQIADNYIYYGSGTPESVVTADIGSLFLRSDGSTSTTLYIKETGTGNTGWTANGHTQVATYDFDVDGGAVGEITLSGRLPVDATITNAWYEVLTPPTSTGATTLSFGVDANDQTGLLGATAIASFTAGYGDLLPDNTAANFTTKTTAARDIIMTVTTADLTAGKINIYYSYSVTP